MPKAKAYCAIIAIISTISAYYAISASLYVEWVVIGLYAGLSFSRFLSWKDPAIQDLEMIRKYGYNRSKFLDIVRSVSISAIVFLIAILAASGSVAIHAIKNEQLLQAFLSIIIAFFTCKRALLVTSKAHKIIELRDKEVLYNL